MMHLTGSYYIDTSGTGYTLTVAGKPDKNGNPTYRPVGYYTSLETAIEGCINRTTSERIAEGMHSLEEGLAIIREERSKFAALLHKAEGYGEEKNKD